MQPPSSSAVDSSAVETVTAWLAAHSELVLLVVALFACLEALFVIGLFVSSVFLVTVATTASVQGWSSPVPIMAAALLGATMGDHLGYFFGRYLRTHHGPSQPPFTRLPARARKALERAQGLFARYGSVGVLLGRFLPPIRSIVPFTAGVAGMVPRRFMPLDLLACALWACALGLIVSGIELAWL